MKKTLFIATLLLGAFFAPALRAETLIHNDGFTGNNANLPHDPPEDWRHYGSNTASSGINWDATEGAWGVTGTPDITLHWTTGNYDTYTNWNGRGNVIQLDSSAGGTRNFAITFIPASTVGVHLSSFELDAFSGGSTPLKKVTWWITDEDGEVLHPGDHWERTSGRGSPIAPSYSGDIGQTLILRLDFTEGSGDYLALDNLKFDQIPEGVTPTPEIFTNKISYLEGEDIAVSFLHGPGNPGEHIAAFLPEATPGEDAPLFQTPTSGTQGEVTFSSLEVSPGDYSIWFLGEHDVILAGPIAIAIIPKPTLALDETHYEPGETITATFALGPGGASDWIGIYPQGIIPSGSPASTTWNYTNGTRTSGGSLTEGEVTFAASSIPPGHYNAWFLQNGGYTQLAGPVSFTVGGSGPPAWHVETIRLRHVVTGNPYTGFLSPYISLANGPYTFEKTDGPAWLTVAEDGTLSGTPGEEDAGLNTFTIRATGTITGLSTDVPLEIPVFLPGQESVTRLSVMSYNTWHAWGQMNGGFRKGIESIARSGADIIGFQESSDGHSTNVANALGWYRSTTGNGSRQLVSRYPIIESYTAGNAIGARIRITENPQRDVIVYSCHLHYQNYGPYAAEPEGATEADVLAMESTQRFNQIQVILSEISAQLANADNVPVFLTGDFNCPSHLDWTVETAPIHHNVGPVAWPVSIAVDQAGMLDSYRIAHPDPLASPGITWSPIHKGTEPQDRIDFVYHKGSPLTVLSSEAFTTEVEVTVGRWGVSVGPVANNTWPSDHASVVSVFSIAPVDSDSNGLFDAWENRWFGSLGNDAAEISNSTGLSHAASMLFGLPPIGPASPPLSLSDETTSPRQLDLTLSDFALGRGLIVQRSEDLENWTTLWSFDADPTFTSSSIESVSPRGEAVWNLRLIDHLAGSEDTTGFFRVKWNP